VNATNSTKNFDEKDKEDLNNTASSIVDKESYQKDYSNATNSTEGLDENDK
jgi:hypothetical protein